MKVRLERVKTFLSDEYYNGTRIQKSRGDVLLTRFPPRDLQQYLLSSSLSAASTVPANINHLGSRMATINSSSEDDRKPLLDAQSSPPTYTSQSQPLDTNNIIDSDDQPLLPVTSGDNAKAENTILTWKTFRIVIFSLLSIFALAIFIKGFIDAEDVEVSSLSNIHDFRIRF